MKEERFRDLGLLVLRVGIGAMFMGHGWPKLAGGEKVWAQLGRATAHLGIDVAPVFFGFMAAVSEFFGGLLIALGFAFRPAALLLFGTMIVAATSHIRAGDGFIKTSHAVEAAIVFLALLLTGPGKHALATMLAGSGKPGLTGRLRRG